MALRGIVTDIEGTTTSLVFVKDVLFPYARRALPGFIDAHGSDAGVRALLEETRAQAGLEATASDAEIARLLCTWIDEDRKTAPLKSLQGLVWARGYAEGAFFGHVYDDAVIALRSWHQAGLRLSVFSSGSVEAQQQLFRHSAHGDLTPLFSAYFDTRTGAKREAPAYRAIAAALALDPRMLLFLSDTVAELDAAASAGFRTILVDRADQSLGASAHPRVVQLTEIRL
ncbi:MAG: acireductone synthase [Acidiferrobacteraceae bacterium]